MTLISIVGFWNLSILGVILNLITNTLFFYLKKLYYKVTKHFKASGPFFVITVMVCWVCCWYIICTCSYMYNIIWHHAQTFFTVKWRNIKYWYHFLVINIDFRVNIWENVATRRGSLLHHCSFLIFAGMYSCNIILHL